MEYSEVTHERTNQVKVQNSISSYDLFKMENDESIEDKFSDLQNC